MEIEHKEELVGAIESYGEFIGQQTLARSVVLSAEPQGAMVVESEIDDQPLKIALTKVE